MTPSKTSSVVAIAFAVALTAGCRRENRTPGRADESQPSETARASTSGSVAPTVPAQAPASPDEPARRSIQELQGDLLKTGVFEVVEQQGRTEYNISPDKQFTLRDLKDELLSIVDRNIEQLVKSPPSANTLENMFVAEGVRWASKESKDGAIDGTLAPAPQHVDRWLVTLCIRFAPGSDCLAAVYERRGGAPRRAIVFRTDRYTSLEGAVHALEWVISPPDENDRFYLLEAHTYPWPSSNWRDFSYSAMVPRNEADLPQLAADAAGFAYWVEGFDLKARTDGFTVSFTGKMDDAGRIKKTIVDRWNKTPAGFQRQHVPRSSRPKTK